MRAEGDMRADRKQTFGATTGINLVRQFETWANGVRSLSAARLDRQLI